MDSKLCPVCDGEMKKATEPVIPGAPWLSSYDVEIWRCSNCGHEEDIQ